MSTIKAERWRTLDDRPVHAFAQVVTTQKTNTQYIQSGPATFVDVMSVTITPRYANSKILVLIMLNMSLNGHGSIQLLKNDFLLENFSGDLLAYYNKNRTWHSDYATSTYNTVYDCRSYSGEILDTAGSTNALTYKLRVGTTSNTTEYVGINYNAYNTSDGAWNFRTASCITAIEVLQGD